MTISYAGTFGKLLFRWKGSLWKSIWRELTIFLILYYSIGLLYRFGLTFADSKRKFEQVAIFLDETTSSSIPISFLLGMYVVAVVKRWWEQFENIAWPDNLMFLLSAHLDGGQEERRILRRTMARYTVLAAALAWRNISSRVLKRFPTADHLVQAGLMTAEECRLYQEVKAPFGRWFLPLNWIQRLIMQEKASGRLNHAETNQILSALHAYKDKFVRQFVFDWVSVPLGYTHVCTVATYGYFLLCLIGRQNFGEGAVSGKQTHVNMWVPVFTILQFLFYMGWLKVAEHCMHPFGEEDDDFELNYILDRHLYVALMIADDLQSQVMPERIKDAFWDKEPWLPHTKASHRIKDRKPQAHVGSNLPFQEMELLIQDKDKQKHV